MRNECASLEDITRLLEYFKSAEDWVLSNFVKDIEWLSVVLDPIFFDTILDEKYFLDEYAFVVCCSGFRNSTVMDFWPRMKSAAYGFDYNEILSNGLELTKIRMLSILNHELKINAILVGCKIIHEYNVHNVFKQFLNRVREDISTLQILPFISDTTQYHLARNIGIDCVKPDLWLLRISATFPSIDTPLYICKLINKYTGLPLGIIDSILWRFTEQGNPLPLR